MSTVRDIMNSELIVVRTGSSVEDLVHLLDEEAISGVPVLDTADRICGVVSRTDVIRSAARSREVAAPDAFWETLGFEADPEDDESAWFLAPESAAYMVPAATFPALSMGEILVDEIMTPVAFTVDPEMSVGDLADFLVRGRIHRALVVEDGKLIGIATAFDLLRVMAGDRVR